MAEYSFYFCITKSEKMKRIFTVLLLSIIATFANAKDIKILNSYISYAAFNATGEKPPQYIETHITFDKRKL